MIAELAKRKAQLKSDIKKYAAEKNYKELDGAEIELAQIATETPIVSEMVQNIMDSQKM